MRSTLADSQRFDRLWSVLLKSLGIPTKIDGAGDRFEHHRSVALPDGVAPMPARLASVAANTIEIAELRASFFLNRRLLAAKQTDFSNIRRLTSSTLIAISRVFDPSQFQFRSRRLVLRSCSVPAFCRFSKLSRHESASIPPH
jgi:hypothetical protein